VIDYNHSNNETQEISVAKVDHNDDISLKNDNSLNNIDNTID